MAGSAEEADGGAGTLPSGARCVALGALAGREGREAPPSGAPRHAVKAGDVAFVAVTAGGDSGRSGLREFRYTHTAALAHARASQAAALLPDGPSLSWLPLAEPAALLAHCAAVWCGGEELHAETGGEPRKTLRLLSRHRASLLAGPAVLFRRALGELRRRGEAAADLDLGSVRQWVVHGADLGDGEAAEFARLAGGGVVQRVLLAPWGALLASEGAGSGLAPAPGIELRIGSQADAGGDGCGQLQARGYALAPGAGDATPGGWIEASVRGAFVLATGGDGTARPLVVTPAAGAGCETAAVSVAGGVKYLPEEIEAAVEAAAGVQLGSAAAVAAPEGGLAVAFVAIDPSPLASAAAASAVRDHLAVALGIRARLVLPLAACDMPRDAAGRQRRAAVGELLGSEGLRASAQEAARPPEEVLPDSWVFEEDFRPCPAGGAGASASGEAAGEEEDADGDDIEERMEGAAAAAAAEAAAAAAAQELAVASESEVLLLL